MPNPADPKAIDISPEAVGVVLDDMRSGQNELDAIGLIIELSVSNFALTAERESLRSKLAEAERERDRLREIVSDCATALGNGASVEGCSLHFMALLPKEIKAASNNLRASRDAALSKLAQVKQQRDDYNDDSVRLLHEKMDAIEALTATQVELAKLRAEAEWRPIESAPKDGTYIMACEPIENDFMQYVCAWSAAEFVDLEAPTRKLRNGWMVNGCDELDPTHWRPIPSPPKDPAK